MAVARSSWKGRLPGGTCRLVTSRWHRKRRRPMRQATSLWTHWQALLGQFAQVFTRPGYRRFVEWITALAINVEEHTVTQSAVAIERTGDWRAMERFAEYGAWYSSAVTRSLARLVEQAPGRIWHGYHVNAV